MTMKARLDRVGAIVSAARAGEIRALSTGEQCVAALVLSEFRDVYGTVEQTARRCGLPWLLAIRELYPTAAGLDLIDVLDAEDRGQPVRALEEEVRDAIASAAGRSMSAAQLSLLVERAWGHFSEEAGFQRIVFWNGEFVGATNRDVPLGWRPGCVAVDRAGRAFLATGGNYIDGADRWSEIHALSGPMWPST